MSISSTDPLSLANKVAIITGSGKENGIGAGIATAFAQAGARVVLNFISESTAPRAAETLARIEGIAGKENVLLIQADATTIEGTKKLVDGALSGFGVDHIDILVNNAGSMAGFGPVLSVSDEVIMKSYEGNVFGPLLMIRHVVPHMPRGGRIINIGTIASKLGIKNLGVYGASKASMAALTYSLARELGQGNGITINTIAPGACDTDLFPGDNPHAPPPALELKDYLLSLPRAETRPAATSDISDVALFLASEKSRWITGQWLSVSGGSTGGM